MKKTNSDFKCGILILPYLAATLIICCGAFAQEYAVLVQQSPAEGGKVNPGQGVHAYGPDQRVQLNAVPNSGYQFVYWIGDVADPTANSTTMSVDGPKIVIAVFERNEFEFLAPALPVSVGPAQLYGSFNDIGGSLPGIRSFNYPEPEWPDQPEEPIPEPTTAAILMTGLFGLVKIRSKIKSVGT